MNLLMSLGHSMKNKRLHMRVAVPADIVDDYRQAKARAEVVAGVVFSDSKFAVSLIKWAILRGKANDRDPR